MPGTGKTSAATAAAAGYNLPPLVDTFPAELFPLREIGTGFTAQVVRGADAEAAASTAADMLLESKNYRALSTSSCGSSDGALDVDASPVPDLPLPDNLPKDGMLILRNERLFPGMVGISLPMKGTLWVREDGTFNLSGFFRRQIPKFETAALVAAIGDMDNFIDVYHAMYRAVMETAVARHQFKIIRTVIGAGLQHYKKEGSPARGELMDLRRRVTELRSRATSNTSTQDGMGGSSGGGGSSSLSQTDGTQESWIPTEDMMERRRSASDSTPRDPSRRGSATSVASGGMDGDGALRESSLQSEDVEGKARERRLGSNERPSKIAQQVVTGAAPKQKTPFRLWKSKTGEEGYDKKTPS